MIYEPGSIPLTLAVLRRLQSPRDIAPKLVLWRKIAGIARHWLIHFADQRLGLAFGKAFVDRVSGNPGLTMNVRFGS